MGPEKTIVGLEKNLPAPAENPTANCTKTTSLWRRPDPRIRRPRFDELTEFARRHPRVASYNRRPRTLASANDLRWTGIAALLHQPRVWFPREPTDPV